MLQVKAPKILYCFTQCLRSHQLGHGDASFEAGIPRNVQALENTKVTAVLAVSGRSYAWTKEGLVSACRDCDVRAASWHL